MSRLPPYDLTDRRITRQSGLSWLVPAATLLTARNIGGLLLGSDTASGAVLKSVGIGVTVGIVGGAGWCWVGSAGFRRHLPMWITLAALLAATLAVTASLSGGSTIDPAWMAVVAALLALPIGELAAELVRDRLRGWSRAHDGDTLPS